MTKREKPRVLIVEDDKELIEIWTEGFQPSWSIRTAERIDEVLFQLADFSPQVILLDINLKTEILYQPEAAGIQILERIKMLRLPFRDTPVIVVTGRSEPEFEVKCRSLGVCEFFLKPISIGPLSKAVEKALQSQCEPDKCVKIFVSSIMSEMETERWIVKQAIEEIGPTFKVELAEEWSARPEPVQEIWRKAIEKCDLFVLLLGQTYGMPTLGGRSSAIEDEYDKAREAGKPVLVFAKEVPVREARLGALLTRILSPSTGHLVKFYASHSQLREEVRLAMLDFEF